MKKEEEFGQLNLGILLRKQSIPAALGFFIMSVYSIVDTIFVGRFVGANGIGAITVVLPIIFLFASIGMAIGVGGASIISRAFGSQSYKRALESFGTQVLLTIGLSGILLIISLVFKDEILRLFGGRGAIQRYSEIYYLIIMPSVPFLAWAMMCNNVIRAEGYPRLAMVTLIVPAILNVFLDPLLIVVFDMGMAGAAYATAGGYVASAIYTVWYLRFSKTGMRPVFKRLTINWKISREIAAIGGVTLARQGAISLMAIVLNNALFIYGGELSMSVYGILNRLIFFIVFPIIGITQGFLPIASYNYGAKIKDRVDGILRLALRSASLIAFLIFVLVMIFSGVISRVFTRDPELVSATIPAMRIMFLATPLIAINLIGSAFFQALGKAVPALFLALLRQALILIPLILLLPLEFGVQGIWYSFPIAEVLAMFITLLFLRRERKNNIY